MAIQLVQFHYWKYTLAPCRRRVIFCHKSVDCICVGLFLDALICVPFPAPKISLLKSSLQETGILSQPWVGSWEIDWDRENSSCHWRWLKPSEKINLQKKKRKKKETNLQSDLCSCSMAEDWDGLQLRGLAYYLFIVFLSNEDTQAKRLFSFGPSLWKMFMTNHLIRYSCIHPIIVIPTYPYWMFTIWSHFVLTNNHIN